MDTVSHLDMFYETRSSVHVTKSSPCNSPNTNLTTLPTAAEIRYKDGPNRFIDADSFEAPGGRGFETARFLISRAMIDPDANVVPKDSAT